MVPVPFLENQKQAFGLLAGTPNAYLSLLANNNVSRFDAVI
jgi:hypothetical protein